MTIYRSYFSKNNTLISGNKTNNGKNPVCEISYGTPDKELSRFLFDVDLSLLNNRISKGVINSKNIVSHTLNMTNTIRFAEEYVGKKSYATSINRASNFTLDLFKVNQEWDEGTSYDFIYGINYLNKNTEQESNWINRKLNTPWDSVGAYSAGTNTVIGSQYFRSGSENLIIDVSGFINSILSGDTSSNGLGIKFQDIYENTPTTLREAVGFHSKYTNTVYEPYIETVIDNIITDDRNYFFLDKENNLYLYSPDNLIVNNVTIYDYEDNIYSVISGASVTNVSNGIYKISLTIDSDTYPDAVIFRDVWNITINGKTKNISNMFYLISQDNYFNLNNQINFDNYFFSFQGIKEREKISSNHIRKIKVLVKEMYPNQNNFTPLDIEYRIFTTVAHKYEIDFIPFTKVNRTNYGYEFNLDTSWLIPQDYKIQIRLKNGYYYENKEILTFKIVSEGINVIDYSIPTTTGYVPTTEYVPTTTGYVATTTEYIPTTTEYVATTTEYIPTTTEYVPTTEYLPTTTSYIEPSLKLTFKNIINADLLISGNSLNLLDWNTFFDLPIYGNPFTSVNITGNVVTLYGGSEIILKDSLFDKSFESGTGDILLSLIDNGSIIRIGYDALGGHINYGNPSLNTLILSEVSIIDNLGCSSLEGLIELSIPKLKYLSYAGMNGCGALSFNFPLLETIGNIGFAYGKPLYINLSSCISLGDSVGYNSVFEGISGQIITLIVPPALMTCNGGNPDGDIQYLQANNSVTIILSTPTTTSYVPTTTEYTPTTVYVPTTTSYVPTTTEYVPTTTVDIPIGALQFQNNGEYIQFQNNGEYIEFYVPTEPTTTEYVPTTEYTPTTTEYVPTTEYTPTTTEYVPTTTEYTPTTTEYVAALKLTFNNIANSDLLISGSSSNVNDWNIFFDLPTNGIQFSSVLVNGNEVNLYGGSGIRLKDNLFGYNYTNLLYIEDNIGCVTGGGFDCFNGCTSLITANFPNVTTTGYGCFAGCTGLVTANFPSLIIAGSGTFMNCNNLTTINFNSLTTPMDSCFNGCTSLTNFNFPSLTTTGSYCFANCTGLVNINASGITTVGNFCFDKCSGLETINLSSCTNLGGNVGYDNVFKEITMKTITLTVPSALMTCNGGLPDGDIQYLQANNSVNIIII